MRQSGAEKLEMIRLVEESEWSVTATLRELGVPRSTFYDGYRRYKDRGTVGLAAGILGQVFTRTAFRTRRVSRWSTQPGHIRNLHPGSWPGRSPIPRTTSSPNPAPTGF